MHKQYITFCIQNTIRNHHPLILRRVIGQIDRVAYNQLVFFKLKSQQFEEHINCMSSYSTFRHSLISFVTKILFFLVKRKFYECILLVLFVSYKHQHFNGFISIKVDTFKE